jgi:uncharacterized membrane protein YgaE (UPF0421/DUF939 family)
MKIGLRTFKTALGAGVAIWIAQLFQLEFASFASIITILCIEKTKKQSLRSSFVRLLACTLSMLLSGVFFELLGFNPLVFSVFLLFFIPLLVKLKLNKGFINSIVIVLHIFTVEKFNFAIAINEFGLIIIGVTIAIFLNSYMPDLEKELLKKKESIETGFKKILFEFGNYLKNGDQNWSGSELLILDNILNEAKSLALDFDENHLRKDKKGYFYYFDMREKQFDILKRMLPIVSSLTEQVPQRDLFAQFLFTVSSDVKSENTASIHLQSLEEQLKLMQQLPLPVSRTEFETRASIFHLMNEMEYYLKMKINFYEENQINC